MKLQVIITKNGAEDLEWGGCGEECKYCLPKWWTPFTYYGKVFSSEFIILSTDQNYVLSNLIRHEEK